MALLSSKTGLPSFSQSLTEINYFPDGGFERGVNGQAPVGWGQYNDGAVAIPVDGTGGTLDGTVTMLVSNSSPIRGALSAIITKPAGNKQGIGFSFPFTISEVDKGLTAGVTIDMDTDTSYAAGDVVFYIYDVTNSILITPRNVPIPKADNFGKFFSDYGLTTGTQYRFILHIATTNASAWQLKIDTLVNTTTKNTVVGPISQYLGTYVPVLTSVGATNLGLNPARNTLDIWRINDILKIQGTIQKDTNAPGGTTSNAMVLGLPAGMTSTKTAVTDYKYGSYSRFVTAYEDEQPMLNATGVGIAFASSTINAYRTAANFPASTYILIDIEVPIAEWAGSSANFGAASAFEYAYWTGTLDAPGASDGSNSASGPAGTQMGTLNDTRLKYVRWQNAPQKTDKIYTEVSFDSGNSWSPESFGWVDNAASTGQQGVRYLDTTNNISRFQVGRYAALTTNWPTTTYIRCVKVNPLAPVGFALGGDEIIATAASQAVATGGFTTFSSNLLVLPAGRWQIDYWGIFSGVASLTGVMGGISTDSNATTFSDAALASVPTNANNARAAGTSAVDITVSFTKTIVTNGITYYPKAVVTGAATTHGFYIKAVRLPQ